MARPRPSAHATAAAARRELAAARERAQLCLPDLPRPAHARARSEYRRIGIVGGGTAGYLTALTLRAFRPEIDVTLIESSRIPVIGVGEATTSEIVPYLHHLLGLDIVEFYREVQPTWKLGIKFLWGRPAPAHFNYPFDRGSVLESLLYDGHINHATLLSLLMTGDKGLVLAPPGGGPPVSLLSDYAYAYHLDNRRFVRYLQRQAACAGVRHLDREIRDAELAPDGDLAALVTTEGERLAFDLYIDCTGFRSALLEKKMKSPFRGFGSSLFTDTAVVASVPHRGRLKPYTLAETMNSGWCWNIPQVEADHRGYVHASAFCTLDEAVAEMRAKNPGMGDFWTVKFRSGRHEHFWKGNVLAIGNSYGFVEPLESTAIQVILTENLYLLQHFPVYRGETQVKEILNRKVGGYWDYIRWFLAVHYRFNRRLDTPFWRACRADVDVTGAQPYIDLYRDAAPLVYRDLQLSPTHGFTFNDFGFDVLLAGQDVPARRVAPRQTRAEHRRRVRDLKQVARCALPQAAARQALLDSPELLRAHVADPDGWVAQMGARLRGKR